MSSGPDADPAPGMVRCPTCRALQEWSDACRRCRSDLRLLRASAAAYERSRRACLEAVRSGDPRAASHHEPTPSSRPPLFLDRLRMSLMSCRDIDFIAFHRATERHRRLASHDAFAPLRGHLLDVITMKSQLLSNLFLREIQPHEIEAEDPGPSRNPS